jgi:hypothetical protein
MHLKKSNYLIFQHDKYTTQSMKLEFWPQFVIRTLLDINKHSMILIQSLYGTVSIKFSIVMEYADGGDLLQKIF